MLWERKTQSVYWTDINRFLLHRYTLQYRTWRHRFFFEPVTCVMETDRKDTLALSLSSASHSGNQAAIRRTRLCLHFQVPPFVSCNNQTIDTGGALALGSITQQSVLEDGAPSETGG